MNLIVSPGDPNTRKHEAKDRVFLLFLNVWISPVKHEKRVVHMTSQSTRVVIGC